MTRGDDNEDGTLFDARANDCVRDGLWLDWVQRGRTGQNPDSLTPQQVDVAYAELITRQPSLNGTRGR